MTITIVTRAIDCQGMKRIDTGDCGYNGTIARLDDGYLFAYRTGGILYNSDRRIRLCILDSNLDPVTEPQTLCQGRHQDPRVLEVENGYLLTTCDETRMFSWRFERRNGSDFTCGGPVKLEISDRPMSEVERNWTAFCHAGNVYFIYTIEPFVVLSEQGGKCEVIGQSRSGVDWKLGFPSGGTPAVPYNDEEYITFFHSFVSERRQEYLSRRYYFNGIFCFSREPPFRITRYSADPVEFKGVPDVKNPKCPHTVVYPAGLLVDERELQISIGVNDIANFALTISREEVDRILMPVSGPTRQAELGN